MNLGRQIAHYRKEQNLTQDTLAKLLGISNQAVSKWETEQSYPDIELLPRIADIFHITLDELFERRSPISERSAEALPTKADIFAEPTSDIPKSIVPLSPSFPWENDETLHVVLFQGHNMIQVDDLKKHFGRLYKDVTFRYQGPALNIESAISVSCENVSGNVTAGSYVECETVGQYVIAGSYVECENVGQYVVAGSYVECEDVGQNVTAGSYIECGDVGCNVSAEGNIDCGDVNQNVNAGKNVDCGDVGGDVSAGGNVDCGDVSGSVTANGSANWGE